MSPGLSRRTLIERATEAALETVQKRETSTSAQDEMADALHQDNQSNAKLGISVNINTSYGNPAIFTTQVSTGTVQDYRTNLCWETYVDRPGNDVGVAKIVHLAYPADLSSAPDPDLPAPLEAMLSTPPVRLSDGPGQPGARLLSTHYREVSTPQASHLRCWTNGSRCCPRTRSWPWRSSTTRRRDYGSSPRGGTSASPSWQI